MTLTPTDRAKIAEIEARHRSPIDQPLHPMVAQAERDAWYLIDLVRRLTEDVS